MHVHVVLMGAIALASRRFPPPPPLYNGGMQRLRSARVRFGLCGLVDIHHIVPRQFANRVPFDMMHSADNLILMPNRKGLSALKLRSVRIVHDGGHEAYNKHVAARLAGIAIDDRLAIRQLQVDLRARIRGGDPQLPWHGRR